MSLSTLFIVTTIGCIVALIFSMKAKRVNLGYTLTTALLIACNGLVIFLIESRSIKGARNIFFIYYLCYAWMFFGTVWTVLKIALIKKTLFYLIPLGVLSALQTAVIVYCFNTPHILAFSKRILAGRIWWVVEGMPDASRILNFTTLNILFLISAGLAALTMIVCTVKVQRIYRSKVIAITVFQVVMIVLEIVELKLSLPFWIYTLAMNPVCYLVYYFAFIHSDRKLRDVVIMEFANEMSDGLIVYNEFKELIHVNDLIKNTMDKDFVEKIKDVAFLEGWLSHEETVENIKTIPYLNGEIERYFIVRKQEIGTEESTVGVAYILHDTTNSITQIRLMEKVNSELERTARMKSDFLANMSHELRTPMNAVIGMAEIALREGEMAPRIKDCLNQINHSGRNLLNIINDILDYSKIDAGKMEIIPEKYEPLSEVNDIANILQTRIGDKNLELFFIVDPSLPHELIGDNMRIRQIIINIANNAIKFTDRGRIRITLDCEIKSDEDIDLIYHIIDTGHGIKEDDLKKLFVSFQQVDSKRNRNVEGTGLGLAISKSLCEAMGGTIGVNSEYGKGSDFWFRIPQKILDPRSDLVVEDAQNKFAYGINEKQLMVEEFNWEMNRLGIVSKVIPKFEDYVPTGKRDFFFIEENYYTKETEEFLDNNPDLTAVVLVHFGSGFKCSKKNVRILSRPMTTLAMVLVLNGKDISSMHFTSGNEDNTMNFIAPDARILVVDDNSINLSIAVGLLEPMKVKCEVAQSGDEALEKIKQFKFDLILMDHMMPGMDGIETTQAIREQIPEAKDTPIIALTANVIEGSKDMFINAGMVDMIAKPIEIKQLNRTIFAWLPQDKVIQANEADIVSAETEGTLQEFAGYDCLDYEKALGGIGKVSTYENIVKEYYKRSPGMLDEIEDAYDAKDWQAYAIKTHALKSSSRQIGAYELGDMAEKLEHAGKAEDIETIEDVHKTAVETLSKLIRDLSKYFPEEEEGKNLPPITDEEFEIILNEMEEACDNLEMDVVEVSVEKLKSREHPENRRTLLKSLYAAVEDIDFERCMEIIEEMR